MEPSIAQPQDDSQSLGSFDQYSLRAEAGTIRGRAWTVVDDEHAVMITVEDVEQGHKPLIKLLNGEGTVERELDHSACASPEDALSTALTAGLWLAEHYEGYLEDAGPTVDPDTVEDT